MSKFPVLPPSWNPDDSSNMFWENFGPRPDLVQAFLVKILFRPDEFPSINEACYEEA